jgi:hypothetical protein
LVILLTAQVTTASTGNEGEANALGKIWKEAVVATYNNNAHLNILSRTHGEGLEHYSEEYQIQLTWLNFRLHSLTFVEMPIYT